LLNLYFRDFLFNVSVYNAKRNRNSTENVSSKLH
jgi:hypothetical protein